MPIIADMEEVIKAAIIRIIDSKNIF